MKQEKQDRRSQRTRRLITEAMLELLFERRYEAITIQDILDRAGIGRSTFYTHYFDKEDVFTSIAEQMMEAFDQQFSQRNVEQGIVPCLELFEHVQQHYHYFQAMLRGHTGEVLWEAAQAALSKKIEQALLSAHHEQQAAGISLALIAQYLAGSLLSLLKWWLQAEMPHSPAYMEQVFQQLALPGIRAVVGQEGP